MTTIQAALGVLVLVGVDLLVGVLRAGKSFDLGKLPQFLKTTVPVEYIVTTLVLALVQSLQPNGSISWSGFNAAVLIALGTIAGKVAKDIVMKLTGPATAAA